MCLRVIKPLWSSKSDHGSPYIQGKAVIITAALGTANSQGAIIKFEEEREIYVTIEKERRKCPKIRGKNSQVQNHLVENNVRSS